MQGILVQLHAQLVGEERRLKQGETGEKINQLSTNTPPLNTIYVSVPS